MRPILALKRCHSNENVRARGEARDVSGAFPGEAALGTEEVDALCPQTGGPRRLCTPARRQMGPRHRVVCAHSRQVGVIAAHEFCREEQRLGGRAAAPAVAGGQVA